jgi:hypothetical protein
LSWWTAPRDRGGELFHVEFIRQASCIFAFNWRIAKWKASELTTNSEYCMICRAGLHHLELAFSQALRVSPSLFGYMIKKTVPSD